MTGRSRFPHIRRLMFPSLTAAVVIATQLPALAQGACPGDPCACLAAAAPFAAVATNIASKPSRIRVSGSSYSVGGTVDADMCAANGAFAGVEDSENDIAGLVMTAGVGRTAVSFKGYRSNNTPQPGTYVGGNVITGGGSVDGKQYAAIVGVTDTSGARPEVAECTAAQRDIATASQRLAALGGTQLGDIVVEPGKVYTLQGGSGLTVFNAHSITLKSSRDAFGFLTTAALRFEVTPGTGGTGGGVDPNDPNAPPDPNNPPVSDPIVVLNVASTIKVGWGSQIVAGASALPEQMLINVYGSKTKVSVSKEAVIESPIIAPGATVTINSLAEIANVYAHKVAVKGGSIADALACP